MSGLPTLESIVASAGAPATDAPAHAQTHDESSGKGGTTSSMEPSVPGNPDAQQDVPEVEAKEEPKAPVDPLSKKFGAIARKERELRAKESEFSRKMADFDAREAARAREDAARPAKASSPLDLLKQHGFKYSDATEQVLGGWKEPEVDPLDERFKPINERLSTVEALAKELADLKSQMSAKEQASAYNQAMSEITTTIEEGGEKYEYIQKIGESAVDLVRDTIVEYFKVHQKMLDYSEACDIVESWYEENMVSPLLSTKKVQSRLAPPPAKEAPKPATPKEAKARTTLTNSLNQGSQATVDLDSMSKDDALAMLAKRLKFVED